jgi:hypothetical protein
MPALRMPFGKYRSREIIDVPSEYLEWLSARPDLWPHLRDAIAEELQARDYAARAQSRPPTPVSACPAELAELVDELVATGFRTMAKKIHPDRGGTNAGMQKLNDAHAWLRRTVRESAAT